MLMGDEHAKQPLIIELGRLHRRLDQLLTHCAELQHELKILRAQHDDLMIAHDRLTRKNTAARTHVQAVIDRLRAMELPPTTPK